jgi:small subunit ribosomal protein S11
MGKKKTTTESSESLLKQHEVTESTIAKAAATGAKKSKRIEEGRVYVNASYNNTVITITDMKGNVVGWAWARGLGFSGTKKATPFASSKVVAALAEKVKSTGPEKVSVIVKGVGSGRDSAIRSLISQGFSVMSIKDATPIPHNGPRAKKVRRV